MEMKTCSVCKKHKQLTDYFKDKSQPSGYMYRCKKCDMKKSTNYQRESGYNRKPKRLNTNSKRRAKSKVANAVKRGVLPRASELSCSDCGGKANHYHHESYARDKWLDVVPLCTRCHSNRHSPSPDKLQPVFDSVNQPNKPNQPGKPG